MCSLPGVRLVLRGLRSWLAALNRREPVQRAQTALDALEILLGHEVHLVEEHPVGERHLLHRLVLRALGLLLI